MRRLCCVALFCVALNASAQIDESGDEPDFTTRWNRYGGNAQLWLMTVPAAAHRGDGGIRMFDNETVLVDTAGVFANQRFTPDSGDVFGRSWVRMTSPNGITGYFSMNWLHPGPTSGGLAGINVVGTFSEQLTLQPNSDAGPGFSYTAPTNITPGIDEAWHLIELAVTNAHGREAVGQMLIDGVPVAHYDGGYFLDTDQTVEVSIGSLYEAGGFTGTIDYDDIRFDGVPLAGKVWVSLGSAVKGACVPLNAALRSNFSDAGSCLAPHDVHVTVSGASIFSENTCATSASDAVIAKGTLSGLVYARLPTTPSVGLTVSDVEADFLPGQATFTLVDAGTVMMMDAGIPDAGISDAGTHDAGTSDAGSSDGGPSSDGGADLRSYYALGCSQSGGRLALLALLLLRRRPSNRTS